MRNVENALKSHSRRNFDQHLKEKHVIKYFDKEKYFCVIFPKIDISMNESLEINVEGKLENAMKFAEIILKYNCTRGT